MFNKNKKHMKKILFLVAVAFVTVLGSCTQKPSSSDVVEEADPVIQTEEVATADSATVDSISTLETAPQE